MGTGGAEGVRGISCGGGGVGCLCLLATKFAPPLPLPLPAGGPCVWTCCPAGGCP